MSTPVRWLIAILLLLVGLGVAAFVVLGGAFYTVGCLRTPPDWVYYILLAAGILTLAASVVPAVMLLRKVQGIRILVVLVAGLVLSCVGYGAYFALLGQNC